MNQDIIKDLGTKLQVISGVLKQEFTGIRASRPTPRLVEDIKVEIYGQQMTVKQLGAISVTPPRDIDISVWDKNALIPIVKAIEGAKLGLTPSADGNVIRMHLPSLTDERRKELEKLARGIAEQSRIRVRGARDDFNKKVEQDFKEKQIGEDQKFKLKKQIQDAVDKINREIEVLLEAKIREINE